MSSHMTLVTPSTSFTTFVLTLLRNDLSKLKVSAVMKSVVTTALNATMKPWTLLSPITPTAFIPREAAYAWLIFRYSPAVRISSIRILSASLTMRSCSSVTSPIMRIARPGPGNGCRQTNYSGIPSFVPSSRTSSLNSSRKGSMSFRCIAAGKPPTLWWVLIVADGPLKDMLSITSG